MMLKKSAYLFTALVLSASTLNAQQPIVVPEGDTLDIRIVTGTVEIEVPGPVVHETTTVFVEVTEPWACPDGWTCTEDPIDLVLPDQVRWSSIALSIDGDTLNIDWMPSSGARRYTVWVRNTTAGDPGTSTTVAGPPYRHALTAAGRHTVGITAINMAGASTTTWKQIEYTATQTGFRIPTPVPMKDGLMVQAVFPLSDIRPITDYTATLNGELGANLPDNLGWYWLPAPETGSILIDGPNETWSASYD